MDPRSIPPDPSNDPHAAMSRWYGTALGEHLWGVESQLLESVLARRFGYHLLQLGCADMDMYASSPIGHKFSFAPRAAGQRHKGVALAEAIPLASDTVDLVLLHHALDYSDNRHQLLREAARILIAGGCMVIVGFNPYSTWGLRRKLQWRRTLPWQGEMLSPIRLTDWLKLLDFQIEQVHYGVYSLPINSPRCIRYSSVLERFAMRLNWPTGGIYVMVAKKQVLPLTPIQESWRKFPTPVGLPAAETIRGASRRAPGESGH